MRQKKWAYYGDIDPYVCEWVRNLMAAGHIASGIVDCRPIQEVKADDLREFAQVHMFCGIAGWSYALRLAGWADDRECWTGSCPCQPLSCAGQRRGHADERHLWPAFYRLIAECKPSVVFGEQIASKDGREWFAAVRADLEGIGYAVGAADLCAAGVGAPHIRQRLWFVADADWAGRGIEWSGGLFDGERAPQWHDADGCGANMRLAHGIGAGLEIERVEPARDQCPAVERGGAAGELADAAACGRGERGRHTPLEGRSEPERPPFQSAGCGDGELADAAGERERSGLSGRDSVSGEFMARSRPGGDRSNNGETRFWSDSDWLPCTDGKARPAQPGIFPLAHGVSARVAKLRAAGNAIVPQVAAEFIRCSAECREQPPEVFPKDGRG